VCALDIAARLKLNSEQDLEAHYEELYTIIAMLTKMATPRS
jgi:hypothetical protein